MIVTLEVEVGKGANDSIRFNSALETIPWHHELTFEERNLISDSNEHPLFEIIDGMSKQEQKSICDLVGYTSLGHYNKIQCAWYKKEQELLEYNKGKKATEDELMNDIFVRGTPLRFKLWYIMMFPDKVQIKGGEEGAALKPGNYSNSLTLLEDYFYYANKVRPLKLAA